MSEDSESFNPDDDEFSFDPVAGDEKIEVEVLPNEDQSIALARRNAFADLITAWGLVEYHDTFPETHGQISSVAFDVPGEHFCLTQIDEENWIGLDEQRLRSAIRLASGGNRYDADKFTLWEPTRLVGAGGAEHGAPYVLEYDGVPDEWLIHREFGPEEEFIDTFGVQVSEAATNTFEEPRIRHPQSGELLPEVDEQLEAARETHRGVIVILGPRFPTESEIEEYEGGPEIDMEEAVEAYKDQTGDVGLTNEGALDRFLERKGVL